jgi:ectoine hydroxylase-related dioxygenase (phytanoyl-CoA dioxygenase family)
MNTLHFWIPLQPVTANNGCLHFIPGSHQEGLHPHYLADGNDRYAITTHEVDTSRAVACPLSVGSATIHLPLTLHAALPNNTEHIRRAWALLFRPFGRFGVLNPLPLVRQLLRTA